MTWVKLDDGFTDHPKVIGLSDRAFRAHVRAMCYCARFSPGVGSIPTAVLRSLGATGQVVTELTTAELWDDTTTGLYIHDFAEYHPKPNSEARAEAGRRGGMASGEARRSKPKQSASRLLQAETKQNEARAQTPAPDPTRPVPTPSNEAVQGAAVAASHRKKKPEIVPLSPAERQKLMRDFAHLSEVGDRIDQALGHEQAKKYPTGQYLYVRGWLRRDAEREGQSNAMGARSTNQREVIVDDVPYFLQPEYAAKIAAERAAEEAAAQQ